MTTADQPLPNMPEPPPTGVRKEMTDLLTCAQANWRMIMDVPYDMISLRDRVSVYEVIAGQFGQAWYLKALNEVAPAVAQAKAEELYDIQQDGSETGPWVYDMLTELGVDPETLPPGEWKPDKETEALKTLIGQLAAELADLSQAQCWRGQFGTCDNGGCAHRRTLIADAQRLAPVYVSDAMRALRRHDQPHSAPAAGTAGEVLT